MQNVSTSDRVCGRCRPAELGHHRCRLCPHPAGRPNHGTTRLSSLAERSVEQRLRTRRHESRRSPIFTPHPRMARRPPLDEEVRPRSCPSWTSPCEGCPKQQTRPAPPQHRNACLVSFRIACRRPLPTFVRSEDHALASCFRRPAVTFQPPCERRSGDGPGPSLNKRKLHAHRLQSDHSASLPLPPGSGPKTTVGQEARAVRAPPSSRLVSDTRVADPTRSSATRMPRTSSRTTSPDNLPIPSSAGPKTNIQRGDSATGAPPSSRLVSDAPVVDLARSCAARRCCPESAPFAMCS